MLLLKEMKQAQNLTEREQDICNYILEHPEQVAVLSSRELGHATYTKVIVISSYKNRTLSGMGDEFLYAAGSEGMEEFWTAMFFSAVKYLLDIMFGLEFSAGYEENMKLNEEYEKIGMEKLWSLSADIK